MLGNKSDRAGLDRFLGNSGIGVHGEDDDLRRDPAGTQLRDRVEPAEARHGQVGDDEVGLQVDGGLNQTGPVEDGAHHLTMVGEQAVEAFGHHHVVISK